MKNDKFIWGFFGFLVIVILFTNPFNANNNKVTVDILSKYQQFNTSVDVNSLSTSECKEIAEEYIYLARQMAKNDKYEKAIESLNNAIEVYPQHEYIYNELADLYLSKAFFENSNDIREVKTSMDFEQAINNAKKNISMHPNYFSTYEALINIYSSIKDYENATKIAFDACNKNPSNKNLCKRVADLYLLQGKKQETIEFYKNIARKRLIIKVHGFINRLQPFIELKVSVISLFIIIKRLISLILLQLF